MGGLSKKTWLIKGLVNDSQLPTLVVTGGNLLFPAARLEPVALDKAKIGADGVLQASQRMGAAFAGIGSCDLAAGLAFLRSSHKPPTFTWLSANLVDATRRAPLFAPALHRQVGDLRIAILALTDHAALANRTEEFQALAWQASLPQALASVNQEADFVLLLSNYSLSDNMEIARAHGNIDLILQTGHSIGNMTPIVINNTLITQTDTRGKYVGMLMLDWQGRGAWKEEGTAAPPNKAKEPVASTYANRFIALKQSLISDPEIEALVRQTQQRMDSLP